MDPSKFYVEIAGEKGTTMSFNDIVSMFTRRGI